MKDQTSYSEKEITSVNLCTTMTRGQRKNNGYKDHGYPKDEMRNILKTNQLSSQETNAIKLICDEEFKNFRREDRPSGQGPYGRIGKNRRDAIWYARKSVNGRFPYYRIHNKAYNGEAKRTSTKGLKSAIIPSIMPKWLIDILDFVSNKYSIPVLNHVVLHRYIDGSDVIGEHQDKDIDIKEDSHIVSISIGQSRNFKIKDSLTKESVKLRVNDGDMILLPYTMNQCCKHKILKETTKSANKVRYSITARSICNFFDPNTLNKIYFD